MFADGSVAITNSVSVAGSVASNARHMYLQAVVGSSGLTSTAVAAGYYMRFDYASSNFAWFGTDNVRDYPVKTPAQLSHIPAHRRKSAFRSAPVKFGHWIKSGY